MVRFKSEEQKHLKGEEINTEEQEQFNKNDDTNNKNKMKTKKLDK